AARSSSNSGRHDPRPVPISVPLAEAESAKKQHFTYTMPLMMRPGPHKLAIGLRDDLAASSSFALHYFTVGR
ncbi:MAG TPA: hypothetical protein PK570_10840, partial [Thermoanaerobaculia bacterium]|nr:hypothetical protein [Thermoanaerobaculia bacterium]